MRATHLFKCYLPEIFGGIPTVINQLATGLQDEGIESDILTCRVDGAADEVVVQGIRVKRCRSFAYALSNPMSAGYPIAVFRRLRQDGLIAHHMPSPLGDGGLWLGRKNIGHRLVVHWHADMTTYSRGRRMLSPLREASLRSARSIIVSDEHIFDETKALWPHRNKVEIIPFGVDAKYWSELTASDIEWVENFRERYPRLVIACGRLVHYKGFRHLLEAATRVDAHFVIIGEGPQRGVLEALSRDWRLTDRVSFPGIVPTDELRRYLHAASVFVLPSISDAETFGIVQLEAMASGCPVINTALPTAVPFVARDRIEGLTVPPADPEALAMAIRNIINEPTMRNEMSIASRERIKGRFLLEKFLKVSADVYKKINIQ